MEKHTEMKKISDIQDWLLTHKLLVKIVLIAKISAKAVFVLPKGTHCLAHSRKTDCIIYLCLCWIYVGIGKI